MPEPIVVSDGPHRVEIPMPSGYTENDRGVPVGLMERTLENAVVSFVFFQARDLVTQWITSLRQCIDGGLSHSIANFRGSGDRQPGR